MMGIAAMARRAVHAAAISCMGVAMAACDNAISLKPQSGGEPYSVLLLADDMETGGNLARNVNALEGGAQNELARVQNPRLTLRNAKLLSQLALVLRRVDIGVLAIVENAEEAVEAHVNGSWLDHLRREGVELNIAHVHAGANITIAEKHNSSFLQASLLALILEANLPSA